MTMNGVHGPTSGLDVFLWLRPENHTFQNPQGDAMRLFVTLADAVQLREATHMGRYGARDVLNVRKTQGDAMRPF